jgi:adenosine deaminase
MRFVPNEANVATVELAKKYLGKGVVALDLAGDESRFPTRTFEQPFMLAVKYKIPFTLHAGEASGPESISEALTLGAERIGHGTNLIKDKELMARFKNENITLEVCVTSNVQTAVVNNIESHPVSEFYKNGLNVTINTDDRSVSGIDLTGEYDIFANRLGFGAEGLVTVIRNGIDSLFASDAEKAELKKSFEIEFKNLKII